MAEQWPASLQQKINQSDFTEGFANTTLRSDSEIGPAKVRRVYTAGVNTLTVSIFLERDDVATFRTFYNTTLNGGVKVFEFTDPISDTVEEFRFVTDSPPQLSLVGGNTFNLKMNWERMP